MSETSQVIHRYPDGLPVPPPESIKIIQNSRGFNVEVKAGSVARAIELYDQAQRELDERRK